MDGQLVCYVCVGVEDAESEARVSFVQHDQWFTRTASQSGTDVVYGQNTCCYCARPVQIDAARLRTARSNDGEWWLVGPRVDLRADEWRDFQRQNDGTFAPTILPVGPDCLRRHPEWRFAIITTPKGSKR